MTTANDLKSSVAHEEEADLGRSTFGRAEPTIVAETFEGLSEDEVKVLRRTRKLRRHDSLITKVVF